ncbi:NAD(P)/FAD-dependent oxidoreductase [Phenylobacterium montanum]|uniref:FAD-dependent oxidoreductase n=1 Tax=Phenylobacterium montanum TaxID=2823693 RepID=A0A975IWE6_9CAUL|nr:FAD-dependent oxidoreductase [Caulobacter sp. S6]QUD89793.1 FAD-dependent oxidoreductase [Caulobacter sp. S6]
MRVAIIGAGLAGLSCAKRLRSVGLEPSLFDKGKGPAGRMASRRLATPLGEAALDMGAPYFTVRNAKFAEQVADWALAGLAAPWPDAAADAWVGAPLMASPLKALTEGLNVRWNAFVGGLSRKPDGWRLHLPDQEQGPFDVVVIALPAEQATPLLALNDLTFMKQSAQSISLPCWTGLFAFDRVLETTAPILRDQGAISWAARNAAKPGRTGPEAWVAHANPVWSLDHLEAEPAQIAQHLLIELLSLTGAGEVRPIAAQAHRWRFAKSFGLGHGELWNPLTGLGVCGDWLLAPGVESAWLSGFGLAQKIIHGPAKRIRPHAVRA